MAAPDSRYRVTICVDDAALRRRLVDALNSDDFDVSRSAEDDGGCDVIILDCSTAQESAAAVLMVGRDLPGDAHLPDNATAETLRLVVAMLGRIARLERRLTETDQSRRRLEQEAQTDPLTGLANRRAWDAELARLKHTHSSGVCVAIADLDLFKEVNSRFGYAIGDKVLVTFAKALAAAVRASDLAARLGGDEFALLMPGLGRDQARTVLERVRQNTQIALAAAGLPEITTSIGYTIGGDVAEADTALRRAKREGRNRVVAAEH